MRKISITVVEPEPGRFCWLLLESREDASVWGPLATADEPCTSWGDAFDAGCVALCKLVQDERVGPQAVGENGDANPEG
ncbi:hypothetical protein [Variovorax flavidus]|uniref:hypothetical protein n=1 Tax=Variovorax flavidus TaxID=3053501 RepID=UPI0025755CD8|nr:hypothetical protein [Variovorax sp. J2P1-59]